MRTRPIELELPPETVGVGARGVQPPSENMIGVAGQYPCSSRAVGIARCSERPPGPVARAMKFPPGQASFGGGSK